MKLRAKPSPERVQILASKIPATRRLQLEFMREAIFPTDLYAWTKFLLGRDRLVERVHGPLCQFILRPALGAAGVQRAVDYGTDWDGEAGTAYERQTCARNSRNTLVLLPRGTYKTTILSEALPLWYIAHNPNGAVMIAARAQDQVTATLNAINSQIIGNADFRYLYGEWELNSSRWTLTEKIFSCRTKIDRTPSLQAVSVGSFKPGYHPQVLIVDDPIDHETVQSVELQERVKWFWDAAQPQMESPKLVYVVGTRWGQLDFYHDLLINPTFNIYTRSVYNPDGTLWFSEKYDEEEIERLKRSMTTYMFSCQFLMRPISRSEVPIDLSGLKFYDGGRPEERPMREEMFVHLAIDPADARGIGDSSWAVKVVGVDADRNFWDLASLKAKTTSERVTREIIRLIRTWSPNTILIENTGFSRTYIDSVLKPALDGEGIYLHITQVTPMGENKLVRIHSAINAAGALVQNGKYHLRRDNYAEKMEFDTLSLDGSCSFDLLDALAYIVRHVGATRQFPHKETPQTTRRMTPDERAIAEWEEREMAAEAATAKAEKRRQIAAAQKLKLVRRLARMRL